MKNTWYPRPHNSDMQWLTGLETADVQTTICPIIMYDEGKGAPSGYSANPNNASFVATDEPNCYPESQIQKVTCVLTVNMTKSLLETDKIHAIRGAFMPIFTSFKEDIEAVDELTSETVGTILELQKESTDRQTYPLWSGTDMLGGVSGANILPATVPGLTSSQAIESVAFDEEKYYDALQYYTNGGKLKKVQGGLNWFTLTRNNNIKRFKITLRSKNKFMNQYSFFGLLVHFPKTDTIEQIPLSGDTTALGHVQCRMTTRFNEWNENYDMERV